MSENYLLSYYLFYHVLIYGFIVNEGGFTACNSKQFVYSPFKVQAIERSVENVDAVSKCIGISKHVQDCSRLRDLQTLCFWLKSKKGRNTHGASKSITVAVKIEFLYKIHSSSGIPSSVCLLEFSSN